MPGRAAIAAISLVTAAFAIAFARVPWPYTDLYNGLQRAEDLNWRETFRMALASGVEYRPLMVVATKAAYSMAGLHLWFYKGIVLANFSAILWLLLVLWRPQGWKRGAAAFLALACLAGLHTSRVLFLFLPLNAGSAVMLMVIATALIATEPERRRVQWALLPLTFAALLSLEFGIFIVFIVLAAFWLRAPGISWRGVTAVCAGLALYLVTRRVFGATVGDLASPESGLGFDDMSPQQIKSTFAHAPWLFWLYNAGSSLLTVILSEPRAGKFKFIHAVLRGAEGPWQWLHVISSLLTTATIVVALCFVKLTQRDRLLVAFGLVLLLVGTAFGFLYTRDRIAFPAGFGYAMLLYVAVGVLLEQASLSAVRRTLAIALVVGLGICWSWRTLEAGVQLRDRAWEYYLEWTMRSTPDGPEPALLQEIRRRVITHRPPDPRRDPRWTYRWFERAYDRAGS